MKKVNILIVMIFTMSILTSCETGIPEVDTTAPTFSFEIRGDGFNHKFTQDDDFSRMQLNLKGDTEYRFIYSGADQGGVALIRWQLGDDSQLEFIQPDFPFDSWTITDVSSLSRMIEWVGDDSDPKTGAILSGRFKTRVVSENSGDSGTFRFFVRDFGGQAGTPNNVREDLQILIQSSDTEVREF